MQSYARVLLGTILFILSNACVSRANEQIRLREFRG